MKTNITKQTKWNVQLRMVLMQELKQNEIDTLINNFTFTLGHVTEKIQLSSRAIIYMNMLPLDPVHGLFTFILVLYSV